MRKPESDMKTHVERKEFKERLMVALSLSRRHGGDVILAGRKVYHRANGTQWLIDVRGGVRRSPDGWRAYFNQILG